MVNKLTCFGGEGGNKWMFIKATILRRFWQEKTLKNCVRNYCHILIKIPRFRLWVHRCIGSYLQVSIVSVVIYHLNYIILECVPAVIHI